MEHEGTCEQRSGGDTTLKGRKGMETQTYDQDTKVKLEKQAGNQETSIMEAQSQLRGKEEWPKKLTSSFKNLGQKDLAL